MKIFNLINSIFIKFYKLIVCAVVFLVLATSVSWLWHMDRVLTEQSEWCISQEGVYPLDICGGIAERDVQKTYYLKIIMLSILAFGSTGLLLASIKNEKNN